MMNNNSVSSSNNLQNSSSNIQDLLDKYRVDNKSVTVNNSSVKVDAFKTTTNYHPTNVSNSTYVSNQNLVVVNKGANPISHLHESKQHVQNISSTSRDILSNQSYNHAIHTEVRAEVTKIISEEDMIKIKNLYEIELVKKDEKIHFLEKENVNLKGDLEEIRNRSSIYRNEITRLTEELTYTIEIMKKESYLIEEKYKIIIENQKQEYEKRFRDINIELNSWKTKYVEIENNFNIQVNNYMTQINNYKIEITKLGQEIVYQRKTIKEVSIN